MTRRLVLIIGALAATAAPTAAWAQGAGEQEKENALVVLTGNARVLPDETVDSVVVFDGAAFVEGSVEGSVVAFNAPVDISGTVGDDVVAFNGTVTVRSGAVVSGDIVSRTQPVIEEGATVEGEIRRNVGELFRDPFPFLGKLAAWLAVSASTLVWGYLLLLLAPRGADRVADAWRNATGPAVGWGLILLIGLPLLAVLALVTVLAIPFGVGLLLALGFIYATGYTAGCWLVGRLVIKPPGSRAVAFLVGWAILRGLALIPVVAGLVGFIAIVAGLGAVAVAVWRARSDRSAVEPAAA